MEMYFDNEISKNLWVSNKVGFREKFVAIKKRVKD